MTEYRYRGLNELQRELDRTAVISKDFKSWIMSWALEVASEAYRAGKDDAEGKPAYWKIKPLLNSGANDCYGKRFTTRAEAEQTLVLLDTTRYEVLGYSAAGKLVE